MKHNYFIIAAVSLATSSPFPLNAGIFSNIFEAEYISAQKESCETAIKEELSYDTDAMGTPIRSGFLATEVFYANFFSLKDDENNISYHYMVRAEGNWSFALIEDPFSKGRYSKKMDVVDLYRVKDLGVDGWDSSFSTSALGQIGARQHIEFRGEAYCHFYSKESKTPYMVSVDAGG